MKILISVIFFVFVQYNQNLFAQDIFGGNPASVRWRQLNTDTVRVIYPSGLDSQALRVARIVHFLNRSTGHSIGAKQRKINIVFQAEVTYENGFVALGPFRSEFYLYPPQDVFSLGSLPPDEDLAIHEYRHVQQYMNFDRGFSKALSFILGEQGQDLGNALTVPNWFFEGDAVFQETLVSQEGRGRLPSFLNDFKSLWTGNRNYSWQKWRSGSYRSLVPNWYPLGYMLVSYGRAKYGTDIWKNIAGDAAAGQGGLYPFQKAVKRYTGVSFPDFRDSAMETYRRTLLAEDTVVKGKIITPLKRNNVVTYQQGFYTAEGAPLVARSSYKKVPAFYVRDARGWHKIRTRDVAEDDYYSYRNGTIVYAAYQADLRWGLREYSDIRVLNTRTGVQRSLTHRSRYFSPDISGDGKKVVAVQVLVGGKAALHILSTADGHLLSALPNPEGYYYVMPHWTPDGNHIVAAVRNAQGMMSLASIDALSGVSRVLLPFSFHLIAYPCPVRDTIYFSAQQGHGDQLMAYVRAGDPAGATGDPAGSIAAATGDPASAAGATGALFQLTSGIRSYYMPSVSGQQLMWSTPAADGITLYEAPSGSFRWEALPVDSFTQKAFPLLTKGFLQDSALNAIARLDTSGNYPSGIYHKASHLINFHSFRPYYSNPDWSFTVYGQNVLNTFQSQVSYDYNQNEQSSNFSTGATYGGWYPYVEGSVGYTLHRTGITNAGQVVHWDEFQANLGTSIPFNLSYGRLYQFLTPAFSLHTDQLNIPAASQKYFASSHINYAEWNLNWSSQVQQSLQQIFPHWAHSFTADYETALGNPKAWQVLLTGSVYLPGLLNSHNLVLSGAFQRRDTLGHYTYTNDFPGSRGYPGINYPEMWRWSANYHFPLAYPDRGIGSVVYFLRVRANVLYDNTQITAFRPNTNFTLRTTGLEVYFDTQWWNQLPVTFGIGYYRLLDNNLVGVGPNQWQILLPILF